MPNHTDQQHINVGNKVILVIDYECPELTLGAVYTIRTATILNKCAVVTLEEQPHNTYSANRFELY